MKTLAIFIAGIALASAAQAGTGYTGNELLAHLQSSTPSDRLQALRYVTGAWNGLEVGEVGKDAPTICTPIGTTNGQIADATRMELTRPDALSIRHQDAILFVYAAVMRHWACKTPATRSQRQGGAL